MKNETFRSELPVLSSTENFSVLDQLDGKIAIGELHNLTTTLPQYYRSANYVFLLIKEGKVNGTINMKPVEIEAPAVMFVSVEHIMHLSNTDGNVIIDTLAFTPLVGEELKINIQLSLFKKVMMRPVATLTDSDVQIVQNYLGLIKSIIHWFFRRHTGISPKQYKLFGI